MWNNVNSYSLPVEMQNGKTALEDSLAVSYRIVSPTLGICQHTELFNTGNEP